MARKVTVKGGGGGVIAQAGSQIAQEITRLGYTASQTLQQVQKDRDNSLKMEVFNDIAEQSNKIYRDNKENPDGFNQVYTDYAENLLKTVPGHLKERVQYELDQSRIRRADQVASNYEKKQNQIKAGESWTYNLNASNEVLTRFRESNLDGAEMQIAELKTANVSSGLYTPAQVEQIDVQLRNAGRMQYVKGGAERSLKDGGLTELVAYKETLQASTDIFDNPEEKDKALLSVDRMISGEQSRLKQIEQARKAKQTATKKLYKEQVDGLIDVLQLGYEADDAFITDASTKLDVLDMTEEQRDLDKAMLAQDFSRKTSQERQLILDSLVEKAPSEYSYFKNIDTKLTQLEKADPLLHYNRQGKIQLERVDYTDPQSIRQRNYTVQELQEATGSKVPLLTSLEQKQLVAQFNEMPANQKVAVVGNMVSGLGKDSITTLNSISKKNGATLALSGQLFMDGAPEVAESIFLGQEVMTNNKEIMPKESELNLSISTNVGTAYSGNPLQRKTVTSAIKAVYADLSRQEGDLSGVVDEARMEEATNMVTGGLIKYESGQWQIGGETSTIEPPVRGMTTDQFEDWVDALTPEDITAMGGSNMNAKEVLRLIKEEAQLESVRVADKTYPVYIIKTEAGAVGNAEGTAPFYLEYTISK